MPTGVIKTNSRVPCFLKASYPDRFGPPRHSRSIKDPMTRADAIDRVRQYFHSGSFLAELGRRVAYRTESQNGGRPTELRAYLEEDMQPALAALDFTSRLVESPSGKSPFLIAEHR